MTTLRHLFWVTWMGACVLITTAVCSAASLPANFIETPINPQSGVNWIEAVGLTFAEDGRMFVWEREGRVWMNHDDEWHLVIDISEEVGGWRDHGLLGFALHPNFINNGEIFLLYVVDRHHLLYHGTKEYDPEADWYFAATIGRITRYTLDPKQDFHEVVPDSRFVLVGETKQTGFPILFESHGIGTLVFGSDDTLLASCGDGANYNVVDTGGNTGGSYGQQAVADGIIKGKENVGSYRPQLVDSLSGKVIRIDPVTGDGIASNPFYNAALPRAPKSRVWALGLRNPCRMTIRPGTGGHLPSEGNPGVLYIGDVGWNGWEELNVATGPGTNFGWPIFEGMEVQDGYFAPNIRNLDAPNPLVNPPSCPGVFYFKQLIVQETIDPDAFVPNPCNPNIAIPDSIPTFFHKRPSIDWGHGGGPARTGIFTGNDAAVINVGASGSPVTGPQFGGNCSIGGAWYTGTSYPSEYQNTYFQCDYSAQWIKSFSFDGADKPTAVQNFATSGGELVGMAVNPIDGDLYYIRWSKIYKMTYVPSGNQPPTAVATSDLAYGSSPLTMHFTGSSSTDPQGLPLQYAWDFDDGAPIDNSADPIHTFTVEGGLPTQFNVTLTVTDNGSLTSETTLIISINNTPPVVQIVSPAAGSTYPMNGTKQYYLVADVTDAEQDSTGLSCNWQVDLHHNTHTHPEPPDNDCSTTMIATPVGCDGNIYFYRATLTVTDAAGLSSSAFVDIYPDCDGNIAPIANDDVVAVASGEPIDIDVLANDTDSNGTLDPLTIAVVQPPSHGTVTLNTKLGTLTYTHDDSSIVPDSFGYTVNDNEGGTSNLAIVGITTLPNVPGDVTGNGIVDVDDLLAVINAWGKCIGPQNCSADVAPAGGNGVVDVDDLLVVINNWS